MANDSGTLLPIYVSEDGSTRLDPSVTPSGWQRLLAALAESYGKHVSDLERRSREPVSSNLAEFARSAPVLGPVTGAIESPSIGSVTNAGAQTLMAMGRPIQALQALGAGYGVAGAKDFGLLDMFGSSEAEARKKAPAKGVEVAKLPGLNDEDNATYAGIMGRLSAGDFSSGAERRALEAQAKIFTDKAGVAGQRQAELEAAQAAAKEAEYNSKVDTANKSFANEMSRDRRFADTEVGKVWDSTGGFAPGLLALGTGALMRAATGGRAGYLLPAGIGAAEGVVASQVPLAYDARNTPVENPERRAYAAKARDLPEGHPDKQRLADYAQTLPEANPLRQLASQELYDPVRFSERSALGALEGLVGGFSGAKLAALPGRALEGMAAVPGRMSTAAQMSRPPSPPEPIGGAGGNAQQPVSVRPPVGPTIAPPNPQPQPMPTAQGSRPVGYNKAQQGVARPLIDSDVAVGGPVPSANALENAYQAAGVKVPTTQKYSKNLNETQKLVSEMQARGMSGPEIVKALEALRNQGAGVLGLAGAGLMSPGILSRILDERQP